jgi:hypothetical protein
MTAFAKNQGTLWIGASTASTLPAPGSDTFTALPDVSDMTPPNTQIATKPYRVLSTTSPKNVGGVLGDQKVPFKIVTNFEDATFRLLKTDSKVNGSQKRNYRITYPNSGAEQEDFVAALTTFDPESLDAEAQGEVHKHSCELTIDGAVTSTV